MLNMSPLLVKACLSAALFLMLIVFEAATRLSDRAKIRSGQAEDMRKNNTIMKRYNAVQLPRWRWWSEAILIIATGAMILLTMVDMSKYQKYGAFYDDSWRMPDVEKHMLFTSEQTEALQEIYNKDPEGFDFGAYKVCLVRMGCEDCEKVKDTVLALDDSFYVVFSRSDIGRRFVEEYGITFIPSVAYHGTVLEMRTSDGSQDSGDGFVPPEVSGDDKAPGAGDVQGMVDDLIDGSESNPDGSAQDGNPGTVTGIGIIDDAQKESESSGEPGNE